jgi:hypothetical protein
VLGAAVGCLLATSANADVLVLRPGATGYKVGQTLDDNARLVVPAGSSMDVVLPSGDTHSVAGPFEDKVSTLTRGVRKDAKAWSEWLRRLATGQQTEHQVGGTRGGTR